MRTKNILFLFSLMLFFTSCSQNDEALTKSTFEQIVEKINANDPEGLCKFILDKKTGTNALDPTKKKSVKECKKIIEGLKDVFFVGETYEFTDYFIDKESSGDFHTLKVKVNEKTRTFAFLKIGDSMVLAVMR